MNPTAPDVVRRAAEAFGDRELLVMPGARLTFAEAEARSRTMARQLLAAGVGKGTRVGMRFGYSPDFVVALLAVTRIGALAAPLSTAYSAEELSAAVRRADIDTLLVGPTKLGRDTLDAVAGTRTAAAPYLRQALVLGESDRPWATSVDAIDAGRIDDAVLAAVEAEVSPADLLVVIQTSGSTAEPKGVVHTHGAIIRKTAGGAGMAGPVFLSMPFFWVGGLLLLCSSLQGGFTLVCQERFEPGEALDLIEEHRVAVVASWFTVTNALRNHPSVGERDLSCIPMLLRDPGEMPYLTPIGMTETLGPHTAFPHPELGMVPPRELWGSNGVTAPGFEHRLVDPDTGEVVEGDGEGELCVRGDALTVGMYKRERSEVFDADGWYRTGDRVARHDGLWWYVGRTAEMFKVRGANVAPPEVEAVLEASDDVEHAFVIGVPRAGHDHEVAAVVVPRAGATVDADLLRKECAERLSRFKVPGTIVVLDGDEVPWLATGKPDKRAMRSLFPDPA